MDIDQHSHNHYEQSYGNKLHKSPNPHVSLGSGPIGIFTNQMIGDSILLAATGGMHERTVLVERQAVGEA